jgi:molybdate transport system substrate-binding protein
MLCDSFPAQPSFASPALLARVLVLIACVACGSSESERDEARPPPELSVYAATSLRDVLEAIAPSFEAARVTFNFAGSNVLARQIEATHGADLFLSADSEWIEYLSARGLLAERFEGPIAANVLTVVARDDSPFELPSLAALSSSPFSVLALADPSAVPAGKYARSVLTAERDGEGRPLWSSVAAKVAPAADVRAALRLVESDPRIIGIVYRTDARSSRRIKVLRELPLDLSDARIRYHAGAVRGGRVELARAFHRLLQGERAQATFARFGFVPRAEAEQRRAGAEAARP